eukprot:scaffold7729_cov120-Isochrysis_galbana.AAC.2
MRALPKERGHDSRWYNSTNCATLPSSLSSPPSDLPSKEGVASLPPPAPAPRLCKNLCNVSGFGLCGSIGLVHTVAASSMKTCIPPELGSSSATTCGQVASNEESNATPGTKSRLTPWRAKTK